MEILNQKRGRNRKSFEILDDGVMVEDDFAKEIQKYKVKFTDIEDEVVIVRKRKDLLLVFLAISVLLNGILVNILLQESLRLSVSASVLLFAVIMIPVFVIAALCSSEFKKEYSKTLLATKPITFFYSKKNFREVDDFIAKIKEAKKNYFLKTYYRVDNLIPSNIQMNRIRWLYENGFITESDAKFIIEQLESKRIIEGL